ncbi:MAG TPA: GNAT family protein [Ktedonobacteraceae bacterium]|jgi:RimJ/RimL family protein N-acetyltransferase|nr:GNAT family protein [Ktedonobacteraceae bacterium]
MELTTEHLILREFEEQDWQAVLAYQSDPLYLRYTPWTQRTEEDVQRFVHTFMYWRSEQPRRKFQLAITLRSNGAFIGNCGIRGNINHLWDAEVGYELDHHYWGRNYTTEAVTALMKFGFEEMQLHRVWAYCIADNVASARVMEKVGMRFEGRLYENEWMKDRWWDTLLYAILEQDWRAQQK